MNERIPLFKPFLNVNYATELVRQTLAIGHIAEGTRVMEFENALEHLLGAPVITTNSGTSAIHLALDLAGVGKGDWVVSTPMTCLATNLPILHRGANIAWADVHPTTGLIHAGDVEQLAQFMGAKAIVAVEYGGLPVDYEGLLRASKHAGNIPIILDAAHSLLTYDEAGANWAHVDICCYSLQAIKHLTTGDGGALIVPPHKFEEAKRKRWFGLDRSLGGFRCEQEVTEIGYKFHMNDIAASIGLANIGSVEDVVTITRENASFYHEALKDIPSITLPPNAKGASWWLYTILVPDRERFVAKMDERGIQCARPHSRNDTHPIFRLYHRKLPGVTAFDEHQVAIPVGWWVTPTIRERIAEAIQEVMKSC